MFLLARGLLKGFRLYDSGGRGLIGGCAASVISGFKVLGCPILHPGSGLEIRSILREGDLELTLNALQERLMRLMWHYTPPSPPTFEAQAYPAQQSKAAWTGELPGMQLDVKAERKGQAISFEGVLKGFRRKGGKYWRRV